MVDRLLTRLKSVLIVSSSLSHLSLQLTITVGHQLLQQPLHHTVLVVVVQEGVPKNDPTCFCQNFVKSAPNLLIFGTQIATMIELCKAHWLSTPCNLCQCTSMKKHRCFKLLHYVVIISIKYKKLTSLHYCVRATKSHIQNSRNHFTRTQSDRTTNWLPLCDVTPFNLFHSCIISLATKRSHCKCDTNIFQLIKYRWSVELAISPVGMKSSIQSRVQLRHMNRP